MSRGQPFKERDQESVEIKQSINSMALEKVTKKLRK